MPRTSAPPLTLSAEGIKLAGAILGEIGRVAAASPGEELYVCSSSQVIAVIPVAQARKLARIWKDAQTTEEAGERVPGRRAGRAPRRRRDG